MYFKNIFVYPKYPAKLKKLFTISYNLWSVWDKEALKLYNRIDSQLFQKLNSNPIQLLHSLTENRLKELEEDKGFLFELEKTWERFEEYSKQESAYKDEFDGDTIAYFSMEYGISEALPIYAGGLGILSGDHLKGASDMAIPIVGVGLLYRYGYFSQRININGFQEEVYKENNPYFLPIKEVKNKDNESIYVEVDFGGKPVKLKIWYVSVGIVKLYLLDSNIEDNPAELRDITNYLYVSDREKRIEQEIILGIAGFRALRTLNYNPTVYHLNEGHSAFLILERFRYLMKEKKMSYDEAFALIKSSTVFTTHTPVEAGNENFPIQLVRKYFDQYLLEMGLNPDTLYDLGFYHDKTTFWLPALAIRLASHINGVSRLHGEVSRRMWGDIYHERTNAEIPIGAVTNGVHYSWFSQEMTQLLDRYTGPGYIRAGERKDSWERVSEIPDEEIWEAHKRQKQQMISFIRRKLIDDYREKGYSPIKISSVSRILNPSYLTIGFARRFAPYKRPTLLFRDKERLVKILKNTERPVQIVCAGKAHPADLQGKNLIKEIMDFAAAYDLEDRVVFIEDYNMMIAKHLVQGVDIWLNTPIRPMEASGTSGMKAGMNGVLNLSILDGWWPECYDGTNGWAITAGESYTNPQLKDQAEASQIYDIIEEEITQLYFDKDENDVPLRWVAMMKQSIHTAASQFNVNRMLLDYLGRYYLPSVKVVRSLTADSGAPLRKIAADYAKLKSFWDRLFVKDVFTDIDKKGTLISQEPVSIECYIQASDADLGLLSVEVYYGIEKDEKFTLYPLEYVEKYPDGVAKYKGSFPLTSSGLQYFNVRIVPKDAQVRALYPEFITWKN